MNTMKNWRQSGSIAIFKECECSSQYHQLPLATSQNQAMLRFCSVIDSNVENTESRIFLRLHFPLYVILGQQHVKNLMSKNTMRPYNSERNN